MKYLIVIENAGDNFSAYAPDLPGCIATGKTIKETDTNMKEAIEMHLEGIIEDGFIVPPPSARAVFADVNALHA